MDTFKLKIVASNNKKFIKEILYEYYKLFEYFETIDDFAKQKLFA